MLITGVCGGQQGSVRGSVLSRWLAHVGVVFASDSENEVAPQAWRAVEFDLVTFGS
jgi:hypothetical protein